MGILERLLCEEEWERFFEYKNEQGNLSVSDLEYLRAFIDNKSYVSLVKDIFNKKGFSVPEKKLVNKSKVGRKRTVYTYTQDENIILKHISFMLRDYDDIFCNNLYSFRKNTGVKKAANQILCKKGLENYYIYKADISNYFNSVDIKILLPQLKAVLSEDYMLYCFIKDLLECPYVSYNGEIIQEEKGIMAGTPISTFLANIYLKELDEYFFNKNVLYMRYSDDIAVFSKNKSMLYEYIEYIKNFISKRNLAINSEKEEITDPGEEWTFLGFSYKDGIIDISPVSYEKLKSKMRRKMRSLVRWAKRKNLSGEKAARAFIRRFNNKFFSNPIHSELTWSRWFFPIINTDKTLKKIDKYMQECIRFLATGTRTKSRYSFKYEDMKKIGYISLVNEYYRQIKEEKRTPLH